MLQNKAFLINTALVALAVALGAGTLWAVNADETAALTCDGPTYVYYLDSDNDGYGRATSSVQACTRPAGYATTSADCLDWDANVHPGATEVCDGKDNDCDGTVDEEVKTAYYLDLDQDGYGRSSSTLLACVRPSTHATSSDDCRDWDSAMKPGATEYCDGKDNDCDGTVDESCVASSTWYRDLDNDTYGNASVATTSFSKPEGYVSRAGDCNDSNAAINPGATEVCDGADNDCDGSVDEGVKTTWYYDGDGDGYGRASQSVQACSAPANYVGNDDDCNDNNAAVKPGATELDDNVDNDCDGTVDEGFSQTWYRDQDGDSYGNPSQTVSSTTQPAGYVSRAGDCNDNNAAIKPGATEVKDGIDNDCDGTVDEGFDKTCPGGDCHCSCECECDCECDCEGDGNGEGHAYCDPFNGIFSNHGQYVSCLAHYTNWLKWKGEITGRAKGQIMKAKAEIEIEKEKIKEKKVEIRSKAGKGKGKGKDD